MALNWELSLSLSFSLSVVSFHHSDLHPRRQRKKDSKESEAYFGPNEGHNVSLRFLVHLAELTANL